MDPVCIPEPDSLAMIAFLALGAVGALVALWAGRFLWQSVMDFLGDVRLWKEGQDNTDRD